MIKIKKISVSSKLGCKQFIWINNVAKAFSKNCFEWIKVTSLLNEDFIKKL